MPRTRTRVTPDESAAETDAEAQGDGGFVPRDLLGIAVRGLLLSIHPAYATMIKEGRKTVELRRGKVGIVSGDMVFFYATVPVRAIVAAGRVKRVVSGAPDVLARLVGRNAGLTERALLEYLAGRSLGSALALGNLVEWRTPIDPVLHLTNGSPFVPPQSYRYLSERELELLSDRLESAVAISLEPDLRGELGP